MTPSSAATATRIETDLLGELPVPADVLYGVQTHRATLNFPLRGERTIGSYPSLIEGLLRVKQAAARANHEARFLDQRLAHAIHQAAEVVLNEHRFDQFPVHRFHGGGGTSANMNANEVLANIGEELLGGHRGQYQLLHPNGHVNLHQSTNDVYPTGCRIAILREWRDLETALAGLLRGLDAKGEQFQTTPRIARTCLQDAVDITFGDFFRAYSSGLERAHTRIKRAVLALHVVNLGGTIVGRASDTPESYRARVIVALHAVTGDEAFVRADNLFDAAQNPDDVVAVSAGLDLLARFLIKIGKDLRLMSSGPEAGLHEIQLPSLQPGSSMMPGKINPVMPEFVIQLGMQVIGNHTACASTIDHGELDLNVWESVIVFNVLDSMALLTNAMRMLEEKCLRGLQVNVEPNRRNATALTPRLTKMAQEYGYAHVDALCRRMDGDLDAVRRVLGRNDGGGT